MLDHSEPVDFVCPSCGADYRVVRQAADAASSQNDVDCVNCCAILPGRQGNLVVKYFLVKRAAVKRRRVS